MLFELGTARRTLLEREGETAAFDRISKSMVIRQPMWIQV